MLAVLILALLPLAVPVQGAAPSNPTLREAMDTLRAGKPGDPAFDHAAKRLPDMLRSRSSTFVKGLERAFSLHLDDLKTRLARAAQHLVGAKLLENPELALARFHARVRIFDAREPGSEPLQELRSRTDVTIAPTPRSSGSSR